MKVKVTLKGKKFGWIDNRRVYEGEEIEWSRKGGARHLSEAECEEMCLTAFDRYYDPTPLTAAALGEEADLYGCN